MAHGDCSPTFQLDTDERSAHAISAVGAYKTNPTASLPAFEVCEILISKKDCAYLECMR